MVLWLNIQNQSAYAVGDTISIEHQLNEYDICYGAEAKGYFDNCESFDTEAECIAGPDGGTIEKPVGTVFIGCHCDGVCSVREFCFEGSREEIRANAITTAMRMLLGQLSGKSEHSMPFQQGATHA